MRSSEDIQKAKDIVARMRAGLDDIPDAPERAEMEGLISRAEKKIADMEGASSSPKYMPEGFVGPTQEGQPEVKANKITRLQTEGQTPIDEFQSAQDKRQGTFLNDIGLQGITDAAKAGNVKQYLGVDSLENAGKQLRGSVAGIYQSVPFATTALELPGEALKSAGVDPGGILPTRGYYESMVQAAPNPELARNTGLVAGTALTAGAAPVSAMLNAVPSGARHALGKLQAPTRAIGKAIGRGIETVAPTLSAAAPNVARVVGGSATGATVSAADAVGRGEDPYAAAKQGAITGAAFSLPEALHAAATTNRTAGGRRTAEYVKNSTEGGADGRGLYRDPEFIKLPESSILTKEAKTSQEAMKSKAATELELQKQKTLAELSPIEAAAEAFKKKAKEAAQARLNKFEDNSGNYLEQQKIEAKGTVQRVQDEGATSVDATKAKNEKWLAARQRRLDAITSGRKRVAESRQESDILAEKKKTGEIADVQQQQFESLNTRRIAAEKEKYGAAKEEVLAKGGEDNVDGRSLGEELQKLSPVSATGKPVDPRMDSLVKGIRETLFPGGDVNQPVKYKDLINKWNALKMELSRNPTSRGAQESILMDSLQKEIFKHDPTAYVTEDGQMVPGKLESAHESYAKTSTDVERKRDILAGTDKKETEGRAGIETRTAKKLASLGETEQEIVKPSQFEELRTGDAADEYRKVLDPVKQRRQEELFKVEEAKKRFLDSIQSDEYRAKDVIGRSKDIAKSKELEAKSAADERVSATKLGSEKDLADKKHNISLAKRRIEQSEAAKLESATEQGRKNIERKKDQGEREVNALKSKSERELAAAEAESNRLIRAKQVKEESSLRTAPGGLAPNTEHGALYHLATSAGKAARARGAVGLSKIVPTLKASQSQLLNPNLRKDDKKADPLGQAKIVLDSFGGKLKSAATAVRKELFGMNAEEQAKMLADLVAKHGSVKAGIAAMVEEEGKLR